MLRGVFVTGTDTGVGKTVVSAALVSRLRGRFAASDRPLRYWKPVQTGIEQDDDTAEVTRLGGTGFDVHGQGVRLPLPLSPHLSARLANTHIDLASLLDGVVDELSPVRWIVEGAGGVLVPINERDLMADLMARLQLPVLIVARSGLGTINHTLLSIEALRRRGLPLAGVVMNGPETPHNRAAIERYGGVNVIAEIPWLPSVTRATLRAIEPELDLEKLARAMT